MKNMDEKTESIQGVAKSAAILSVALVISQLIGLLSKSVIGAYFGASAEVDAFLASNRLTETIFNLMAGGALASAFVPSFSALLNKKNKQEAWLLASRVANLLFIILSVICAAGFLFAPQIVRYILVPGFSLTDPGLEELTVKLLRIQLPSVLIFGISGLMMGILNSNGHFFFPGIAPAMYQIGILLSIVFLSKPFGIEGAAIGAVLGSLFHFLIQLPQLFRIKDRRYFHSLGIKDPQVHEILKLMIPRQIGASATQLNFLVNNYLASFLAYGSISAISWGLSIMLMPQAAIAQSVATVSLPLFSVQIADGRLPEMRHSMASALRLVLILAIPASIGLILMANPIVSMIFERRSFTSEMTAMVSWALIWYAAGLIGHCVVEVVSRAFYAMHDTKTPVVILFIAMALNMAMSLAFVNLFEFVGWMPHGGLALANSLATALEMCALLFFMRKRLKGLEARFILNGAGKGAIAAVGMALAIYGWVVVNRTLLLPVYLIVCIGLVIGIAVYFSGCALLHVEEIALIRTFLSKRR